MKIEQLVKEVYKDYIERNTLPHAEKMQILLEWADNITAIRTAVENIDPVEGKVSDYETELMRLGEFVFNDVDV